MKEVLDIMKYKNWVVIGDFKNSEKYAYRIYNQLKNHDYNVDGVKPNDKTSELKKSLKEVDFNIDVVDLCINPNLGIKVLEEVKELNIKNVLIQPGAESEEILEYCKTNNINVYENCALVQLRTMDRAADN